MVGEVNNESMRVKLAITCGKSSGVLASIVVTMRKADIPIHDQQHKDLGDFRVVELQVTSTKPELTAVRTRLLSMADIIEVKAYAIKTVAPVEAAPSSSNQVVSKLLLNFPNVASTVVAYSAELEHSERPQTLFDLGMEVAEQRKDELASVSPNANMAETVNQRVIPDLSGMATLEYAEEGYETGLKIMVSDFTRPELNEEKSSTIHTFGSLEADASRCDFLAGYIQGVLRSNPSTSQVSVEEIHCRNEGHPYCLFECG